MPRKVGHEQRTVPNPERGNTLPVLWKSYADLPTDQHSHSGQLAESLPLLDEFQVYQLLARSRIWCGDF